MKTILARALSKFANPKYYTLLRLIALSALKKSNAQGQLTISGYKVKYNDMKALVGMYNEIIYHEHYNFPSKVKEPVIIDCGANIGLSVLYFQKLHPTAKIIAIEADPVIAEILAQNLKLNSCKAEIVQKAAWTTNDSEISFGQAGADSGSIFSTENVITVPTIRFKDLLESYSEIELIKIDIEGAEIPVVEDSYTALGKAKFVFIEFHSFPGQAQKLETILSLMSSQGFRYKILPARRELQPFMQDIESQFMDVQLNVFFYK